MIHEIEYEYTLREQMMRTHEVMVYGAGEWAKTLAKWLKRNDTRIKNFIVSDNAMRVKIDDTADVLFLKDAVRYSHVPVLVAVSSKYRPEILKQLVDKQFQNIYIIGDGCYEKVKSLLQMRLSFQTHIVNHCNLNCRGCYHFSPLSEESYLSLDIFEREMRQLGQLFTGRMERILLLGGEPLLHPNVANFLSHARRYFPIGKLMLLTNGILLPRMPKDFFYKALSYDVEIWVTKYPIDFDYEYAEKYALSHGIELHYFNKEPVRTLGHQPLDLQGNQDAEKNFNSCYRPHRCIDLKHGRMYPCFIPAEIAPFYKYFSMENPVTDEDSIDIFSVSSGYELLENLQKPIPFCRYCNRTNVQIFGSSRWSRTQYSIAEWTE